MIDGLTKAQAQHLVNKHLTGDFGVCCWKTVKSLFDKGMIKEVGKHIVVTAKGQRWVDNHHLEIV